MGAMQHVELPVSGRLDTANPSTSRPPGSLVEAIETAHLWWGPRPGFTQQTWPTRSATGYVLDGTNDYFDLYMRSQQQFNLPTKWTLDVVFRPTEVTHSSDTYVPIFQWYLSGVATIGIYLVAGGSLSGDQRKVRALVTPTSSPGVAGTSLDITGGTQVSVGTAVENVHHVRLTRDGDTLALRVDNVADATSTGLVAAQRHEAAVAASTVCHAYLGFASGLALGANHLFKGRIHTAVLRAGVVGTDATKGLRPFAFSRAAGIRLAYFGNMNGGNNDQSLFGNDFTTKPATTEAESNGRPYWLEPIQGGAHFVDAFGKPWNAVMTGGALLFRRVA